MQPRVLVTGATGFIGSEFVKKICNDYETICLIRIASNKDSLNLIKEVLDKVSLRYGNLSDFNGIKKIVRDVNPNYIVNIGAVTPVRHSFENPIEYQETNYLGTVNLVHAALELSNLKKFIQASTMEVYGLQSQREPFKEDLPLNPLSPYGVSKVAADRYVQMAGKAFNLPFFMLRCCNTFGRKNEAGYIIEHIVTNMLKNEDLFIGTPDAVRDLMYVDDHINAYVTALKSEVTGEIFNFGNSSTKSMIEVAEMIKNLTNSNSKIIRGFPPDYPYRPIAEEFLSVDASKAKEMLGWKPEISLEEGFKKVIEHWKNKI